MITSQIVIILNNILQSIMSIFPDADPSVTSAIGTNLTNFKTTMDSISYIFPLSQFFVILTLIMVIENGYAIYQSILWVIRRLPFIG